MFSIIGGIINLSWRMLLTCLAVNLLVVLVKDGKGTIRELMKTLAMAIRVGILKLQKKLFEVYKDNEKES